jgi:hypothetical protein
VGGSDCELLSGGWLAQPVNAVSSAAYLVAAAGVLVFRRRNVLRSPMLVSGVVALALVSVGSFAFHGPQPSWADTLHDGSITALLVVYVFLDVRTSAGLAVAGAALTLALVIVIGAPSSVPVMHAALAVAVVALEWRRRKRGLPGPPGALTALAVGIVLYALGRTDGALCDPGSVVQAHAGWHVLSAAAAGLALIRPSRPAPWRRS